jgi:AcrR family transcriptional regulator
MLSVDSVSGLPTVQFDSDVHIPADPGLQLQRLCSGCRRVQMSSKAKKVSLPAAATDKGSDRRMRILAAARHRFAASGFELTTVRQIADDVGLLAGSLYYHFANKEQLLHETVRDVVGRLCDGAEQIGRRDADPETNLVALIFFDVEQRTSDQDVHAILHQERATFRRDLDFGYVQEARRRHYLVWRALLEKGIAQGYFSKDINVFLTLSTIIRMFNTGADWFVRDDPATRDAAGIVSSDELSAFYVDLILRVLRTPTRIEDAVPWPKDYRGSSADRAAASQA